MLASESGEAQEEQDQPALAARPAWKKWAAIAVGASSALAALALLLPGQSAGEPQWIPAARMPVPVPTIIEESALNNLTSLAGGRDCPKTCHGYDCNFWVGNDYKCPDLEQQYGCNCGGCSKCNQGGGGSTCKADCHKNTCDFWTQHGYTCSKMQDSFGCDCTGCECNSQAPATTPKPTPRPTPAPPPPKPPQTEKGCQHECHSHDCDVWSRSGGYTCSIMEKEYGCNCAGCACELDGGGGGGGGKTPAPSPKPTPPPSPPSDGEKCAGITPTHYYPLPRETYTKGIPSPLLAYPSGMTMCEVGQLQQVCLEEVNRFRRGAPFSDGRSRHHGSLGALSPPSQEFGKCMNEKALSDLYHAEHNGKGCGHFTMSLDCGLDMPGGRAENSCCPRNCRTYADCKRSLLGCLQQMWDEGQIVLDTGNLEWSMSTGHYWNMINTANTKAACGFGFDSNGKMLATQNFF